MQGSTQDHTFRAAAIICFLIALIQTLVITGRISISIAGEVIVIFLMMIAITGITGFIINSIFQIQDGYWFGLALAIVFDVLYIFQYLDPLLNLIRA